MHRSKADYLKSLGADEVVAFDLQDESTWGPALEGVGAVYSASLDPLLDHHLKFSKFLGTLGDGSQIQHVVRVRFLHGRRHQHRSTLNRDTNNNRSPDCHRETNTPANINTNRHSTNPKR